MSDYVCAFRGRRDDYQVPLALAEAGRLDRLITDAYAGKVLLRAAQWLPQSWRRLAQFRYKTGLPSERVHSLWGATLLEHIRHRLGCSRAMTYARIDRHYSEAAARRARAARANLFLYSPYAWEAFTARYAHQPRRVLFQFHPLPAYEERLLRADVARFPEVHYSFAQETGEELPLLLRERVESPWRHADLIFCASEFTRQTLLEAGADEEKCVVIPYGIEVAERVTVSSPGDPPPGFEVLFVGSGVQRKGLHHLLRAWENARLPASSRLTLVCRVLDPGLRERIERTPRVCLRRGVSAEELDDAYHHSTLLAMPSLTEGFGQVYLEALARGCPVLGTSHTCLPDLGGEAEGVFLSPPADLDALTSRLEELAARLPGQAGLRTRAWQRAREFTWPRFRRAINSHL